MIPKTIHYCWFGGKPLSESAKKCINSWKKYFPDYEIKEWNESNFDINTCTYAKEAYEAKKWAFVSDYARFYILYKEGGIYFDTDVEAIKSFSDILENGPFMGCEKANFKSGNIYDKHQVVESIAPGLGLGASPGLYIYREILEKYKQAHFIDNNGSIDTETVVSKVTNIFLNHGFNPYSNELQKIEDIWIYPPEYFCPMDFASGKVNITKNTHSIHHYTATWYSWADKMIMKIGRKFSGKGIIFHKISRILDFPFRVIAKIEKLGIKNTIRFILNKFN